MKVKELINQLKRYNPQARVIVPDQNMADDEDDDWSYLYRVGWSYDDDGKTNKNLVKLQ